MPTRAELEGLSRKLVDEGRLIAAGFVGLQIAAISPRAPQSQLIEMEMAFMAGAQHLFASIMTILDPGEEPTDKDMQRLDLIGQELAAFAKSFEDRFARAKLADVGGTAH